MAEEQETPCNTNTCNSVAASALCWATNTRKPPRLRWDAGETEGGPDNRHKGADQWLYVVSGVGQAIVNGEAVELREGRWRNPVRDKHEIRNTGSEPLRTLNVYVPPAYTGEGEELAAGRG